MRSVSNLGGCWSHCLSQSQNRIAWSYGGGAGGDGFFGPWGKGPEKSRGILASAQTEELEQSPKLKQLAPKVQEVRRKIKIKSTCSTATAVKWRGLRSQPVHVYSVCMWTGPVHTVLRLREDQRSRAQLLCLTGWWPEVTGPVTLFDWVVTCHGSVTPFDWEMTHN